MPIEKTLFAAPLGLDAAMPAPNDGGIEVEIIDDLTGEVVPTEEEAAPLEMTHDANLADFLSDGALIALASELEGEILLDIAARGDWEKSYKKGLELLGLHMEDRTEPWPGACGVYHPMITEASVRFQAEMTTETFPAAGPVRTKILGKETPERKEAAARVEEEMNHQLTDVMQEYRPEHERMLWNLPMVGSAFKKVYKDTTLERAVSMFVPAEDIILPYGTTDLGTCNRLTHRFRKTLIDIERLQDSGFYRKVSVQENNGGTNEIQEKKDKETGDSPVNDLRPELYEVHADLCLKHYDAENTDISERENTKPYVVTLVRGASQVLAVRRNWEESDQLSLKNQHFVHYQYVPGFGAYGFGLFHLIGGYARSATSLMRQLVDAGTLSNLPGGYKTKGLRVEGGDAPIKPGEFRDVNIGAGTLAENIMPLPYKEPSVVLAGLLDKIVEDGRRMAATADIKIADMSSQAPVGTTLALLERTLKVMTAVQARCHAVLKQEFKLIARIIRDSAQDYSYEPDTGTARARQEDFAFTDIIPVSDPNAATMSQRLMQYQAALQMAEGHPQIYNMPLLHREMLDVLGIKNAAKIVPMPEDMKAQDPVTENGSILTGKPVKAFIMQDHEAHIAVHQMLMQDPQVLAAIGQNPQAQNMQAAMMAHVAEHAAFRYRAHISQQLGLPLPDPEQDIDPQVEREIAPLLAQAAQQAMMQNQRVAAQQQAAQQANDPAFMLEQKKLAQKDQEIAIKGAQVKGTLAIAADKQELEERKFISEHGERVVTAERANQQQAADISARGIELARDLNKPAAPEKGAKKDE